MPTGLPPLMKSLVIQQWLEGKPRNNIASENGLSAGAVTNIVNDWRRKLGSTLVDELRELAVAVRKVGITVAQCALGFRVASLMHKLGVSEESLEPFILDIYNRCIDVGLSPEYIASHMQDLLEFSRAVVPLPKISNYIKEKTDEKRKLEEEIQKLKTERETLALESRNTEAARDMALQQERMTISEIKWYSQLKLEFRKHSIPVDDISKFTKLVYNLRQYGYDVGKLIEEFSDLEFLRSNLDILRSTGQSLESKINTLEQQRTALEAFVNMHGQTLSKYTHLQAMGFGLKELDFLWNTVSEIAFENNIPVQQAVTKFLNDVETDYHRVVGFKSKVESLRDEVNRLNQDQSKLHTELLSSPLVGPILVKLTQSGVSERDIINIGVIFEKYVSRIDRESFISELNKYGTLKSAVENLTKDSDRLRQEVKSLQTQKRDLNAENQGILLNLVHARNTSDFLHGRISSLRDEILGLVTIIASISYMMKLQFENHQTTELDHYEFVSLTKASKGGEEAVSLQDLKRELTRAIELTQSRLEADDGLSEILSNARIALTDKSQQDN